MIRLRSGALIVCLYICGASISEGAATITTTGTVSPTYVSSDHPSGYWTLSDHLYVGSNGTGTVTIQDGARVSNLYGMVAHQTGGNGRVDVTGSGSIWQNNGTLSLGQAGTGQVFVTDGGRVTSTQGELGKTSTGNGSVTVTGTSSRWDITQRFILGDAGNGTASLSAGGRVISGDAVLGQSQGGEGQMTVTGTNSLFAAIGYGDSALVVGDAGEGSLQIEDGAVIVSGKGFIGKSATGVGEVRLADSGSRWSNVSGDLYVGGHDSAAAGTGLLEIGTGSSVDADNVTVWNTGTIQGAGTLVARNQAVVHGTVKPGGSSIDTLTVQGNLNFESGSHLEVQINNRGQSDCVTATGDVAIAGGTVKAISTETITQAHEFTVVQGNSVSGQFTSLDTALLQTSIVDSSPTLTYHSDAVKLRVTARPFSDASLTQTSNQVALGTALQTIADAGGNQVTTQLQSLGDDNQVRDAYDQLCGQSQLGVAPVTSASTDHFQGMVTERLGQVRSVRSAQAKTNQQPVVLAAGYGTDMFEDRSWGVWGKGYGLFGDRETPSHGVGYGYTVGGGGAGVDYRWTDTWMLGLTLGVAKGDIDYTNASATDFDSIATAFYATGDFGPWYVDGLLSFAHMDYSTQRFTNVGSPETLTGNFNGREISGYVEVGYDWDVQKDWAIQPLAGFRVSQVTLDGYSETGGATALTYARQRYASYRSSLGMTFTRFLWFDQLTHRSGQLELRARWDHEFGDNQSIVDASFASNPGAVFTVSDNNLSRNSGVYGAGLFMQVTDNTQVRLDYDMRFRSEEQAHVFTGLVEVRW